MLDALRTKILLISISLLLLTSCKIDSSVYSSSQQHSLLNPKNLASIQEIATWSTGVDSPISLITFSVSLNKIVAAIEAAGEVIYIDIENGQVTHKNVTELSDFRTLSIDQNGEKLIGAMLSASREQTAVQEYFEWTAVYNIDHEAMLECLSVSCESVHDSKNRSPDIGAVIDLSGETIITYDEDAYRIIELSDNGYSGFSLANSPDSDYWWHIGKVALDTSHDRLAIIFQEGRIELGEILEPNGPPIDFNSVLNKGVKNDLQPVNFATFDPSGRWLAVIRGDQLDVWNVDGSKKSINYKAKAEHVSGISFDPSGELLFVASQNIIQVIGLDEKVLILELETPGITSLHASENGQWLLWGDINGVAHVWGIPKPQ